MFRTEPVPLRAVAGALLLGVSLGGQAVEPLPLADLKRAFVASQAMERGEADASPYRAGRFDGYLVGVAEVLATRGEICLPACFCHVRASLDPELASALADPRLDLAQPALPWLAARLRAAYPCPPR